MNRLLGAILALALVLVLAPEARAQLVSIAGWRQQTLPCATDVFIPVVPSGSAVLSEYLPCAVFLTSNSLGATAPGSPTRYLGLDASNSLVTGTPSGGGGGGGGVSGPVSSINLFVPQWSGTTGTLLGPGLQVSQSGGVGNAIVESMVSGFISNSWISGLPNANLANSTIAVSVPSWLVASGTPAPLGGSVVISGASLLSNQFLATPNGSAGVLSPRVIVPADLPLGSSSQFGALECGVGTLCNAGVMSVALPTGSNSQLGILECGASVSCSAGVISLPAVSNAQFLGWGTGSGSGTAGAVSIAAGAGITFTCSGATCTVATSGIMGPGSSTNLFVPQWNGATGTILSAGLPVSTTGASSAIVESTSGGTISNSLISGLPNANLANSTITLAVPSWLQVSGSPVSLGGTMLISGTSQTANQFVATPNGSAGAVALRTIVPADLPLGSSSQFGALECGSGTTCTAGVITVSGSGLPTVNNQQFLGYGGGSGSGTAQAVTLAAGTGVTITCSAQTCTVGASGSGGVSGPGSSVNNDVVAWSGTAGAALKDTNILYTNLATLTGPNVFTGVNTLSSGNERILGTSTGYTALASANTSASNFTITFPAATDTVDLIAAAQALSNKTYNGLTITANGTNTLNIAAGKTLTDTSAAGPVLLLGATGGGFTGYAGTSCTSQVLTAVSSAGLGSCASVGTGMLTTGAVTYAKIQNENANTALGNSSGTAAAPSEIALGTTGNSTIVLTDSSGNMKAPVNTTTGTFSGAITAVGGSLTALTALSLRDTSAAFNLTLAATSSTALTVARTLALDVVNGSRTLKLGANLTLATDPGAVTGALKSDGAGTFSQASCADLINCPSLTATDGTHSVANATSLAFGNGFIVGGTSPSATVNSTVPDNTKTTSYTVAAPDMQGALNLAGTTGTPVLTLPAASATIFAPGMPLSIVVTGTVPWTITNSTGLTMTGLNSTSLPPGSSGDIVANANGTGLDFFPGTQPPTSTAIGAVRGDGKSLVVSAAGVIGTSPATQAAVAVSAYGVAGGI